MNDIEKKTKPPDKPTNYFKCVKIPLKYVLQRGLFYTLEDLK